MTKHYYNKNVIKGSLILGFYLVFIVSCTQRKSDSSSLTDNLIIKDSIKQKVILERIISLLPPDNTANGRVSFLDDTFKDWVTRTGELPPDFERLPSIPFLPDPLILDEGGKDIPVRTMAQWEEKREWMKQQLEYYITGTYPHSVENFKIESTPKSQNEHFKISLLITLFVI